MLPPILNRIYDTAMGIAQFEQLSPESPTGVLEIEAPPSVQATMMKTLVDIALPNNVKHLDERAPLQGVVVLGPLGMRNARIAAERERLSPGPGGEVFPSGPRYERDPSLEYVEVDATPGEVTDVLKAKATVAPPAVRTRAQEILAKRRGQTALSVDDKAKLKAVVTEALVPVRAAAKVAADQIVKVAVEVAINSTPVSKNPAPDGTSPDTTAPHPLQEPK